MAEYYASKIGGLVAEDGTIVVPPELKDEAVEVLQSYRTYRSSMTSDTDGVSEFAVYNPVTEKIAKVAISTDTSLTARTPEVVDNPAYTRLDALTMTDTEFLQSAENKYIAERIGNLMGHTNGNITPKEMIANIEATKAVANGLGVDVDTLFDKHVNIVLQEKDIINPKTGEKNNGAFIPGEVGEDGIKGGTIVLAKIANATTLVHEFGHLLEANLSESDRARFDEKYGIKDGQWTEELQEQFADDFVRYLTEGKAPTVELEGVFAKLKQALHKLLGSIRQYLNPEVRKEFARLLGDSSLRGEVRSDVDTLYQRGYVGYSRSVRSQNAIWGFEAPISMINKTYIADFLDEYEDDYSDTDREFLKSVSAAKWKYVARERINPSSWHHTGYFYNQTDHYKLSNIADFLLEHKDSINEDYKAYRRANTPSKEYLQERREEKAKEKAERDEKLKLFKYDTQYKTESGFLKSQSVDIEKLKKVRTEAIQKRREELRKGWERDPGASRYLERIEDDDFIDTYVKAQKKGEVLYQKAEGYDQYIDDVAGGGSRPPHKVTDGLPLVFKEIGVSNKDIILDYKQWREDHRGENNELSHPEITPEMLKELPAQLSDPIIIFDSVSRRVPRGVKSLVIFTDIGSGNDRIMIAVHLDLVEIKEDRHGTRREFHIHKIASAYEKTRTANAIRNWHEENTRYVDVKRANELLTATEGNHTNQRLLEGVQFPQWEQLTNRHGHRVVLKSELVKKYPRAFGELGIKEDSDIRFQSANTAGAELNEESEARKEWREKGTESSYFKKWFGNSKVVDGEGKPLVVYHGSRTGGFATFGDGEKMSSAPEGSYFFSSSISVAYSYSGTYDNGVPQPYTMEEALSEYLIDSDYSEGYEVRDYEGDLHDEFETAEEALAYTNENLEDFQDRDGGMYKTYLKMEDPYEVDFEGANWDGETEDADTGETFNIGMTTNDVARQAMDEGYDGVIIRSVVDNGKWGDGGESTVYIVFSPEQIKSATDNIGTFDKSNPDIRYQVADENYMKAPNGEDTNLSEEQWNRVRTDKFRDVLGNFDKVEESRANLEKFYNSEPLRVSATRGKFTGDVTKDGKYIVEYIKSIRDKYWNIDRSIKIEVVKETGKKTASEFHGYKYNFDAAFKIPEIIKNMVYIGDSPNIKRAKDKNLKAFEYYLSKINHNRKDYIVKVVVKKLKNGHRVYGQALSKIEIGSHIKAKSTGLSDPLNAKVTLYLKDTRLRDLLQGDYTKILDENGEPKPLYLQSEGEELLSFAEEGNGIGYYLNARMVIDIDSLADIDMEYSRDIAYKMGDTYFITNKSAYAKEDGTAYHPMRQQAEPAQSEPETLYQLSDKARERYMKQHESLVEEAVQNGTVVEDRLLEAYKEKPWAKKELQLREQIGYSSRYGFDKYNGWYDTIELSRESDSLEEFLAYVAAEHSDNPKKPNYTFS